MRVLFLQQQPCVRALKYAVGLAERAPEVTLGFAYRGFAVAHLWAASGGATPRRGPARGATA